MPRWTIKEGKDGSQDSRYAEIEKLFGDWSEAIIWSCLQKIMGSIYKENLENPQSAMAVLGVFCFFAGSTIGRFNESD